MGAAQVEGQEADARMLGGPDAVVLERGIAGQALARVAEQRRLLGRDPVHAGGRQRVAGDAQGDGADHVRRAGLLTVGSSAHSGLVDGDELTAPPPRRNGSPAQPVALADQRAGSVGA